MKRIVLYTWLVIFLMMIGMDYTRQIAWADSLNQIPTVAIPTVTSSPYTALARVTRSEDQINVRAGPAMEYPALGILIAGQEVPALGRSAGGLWIQIAYPGAPEGVAWVYAPLVELLGSVPIVPSPATPTPRTTPTVDPTLASQFVFEIPPTRLPTYTPPPALLLATIPADTSRSTVANFPMGFLIVGLGVIGLFGTLLTLVRGR